MWKWIIVAIIVIGAPILFFSLGFHHYFKVQRVADELTFVPPPQEVRSELEMNGEQVVIIEPQQTNVLSGNLQRIDAIHKGEGVVELLEYDYKSQFVQFKDVRITNGPDLYVYVSDQPIPGNTLESLGTYTDLGRLRGNEGTLIYEIPESVTHDIASVVVWCKRFGVLFTYATLAP